MKQNRIFQVALELAEQQENDTLKTFVEKWLRELNMAEEGVVLDSDVESTTKHASAEQGNKKPRRGGQWKGKVKIAEDFDELPESFMEVFRGEDE